MTKQNKIVDEMNENIKRYEHIGNRKIYIGKYKGCTFKDMINDFYYMSWYASNMKNIKADEYFYLSSHITKQRILHYIHGNPLY
jgi:hypothetical protein